MHKQIWFITTAAIMLTAIVTIALYNGSEMAQAQTTKNATAAAGGNMTNATAAAGGNMTQPLVPAKSKGDL